MHADLAQWLTDEAGSSDEQQLEQQLEQHAQWQEDDEVEYVDDGVSGSPASTAAKTATAASPVSSNSSRPAPSQSPQRRRSSLNASQTLVTAATGIQSSKPRKRPAPTFQLKTKKTTSYAEQYAATAGIKPAKEAMAENEQAEPNVASAVSALADNISQLAGNVEILVITPFTANGVRRPTPPACVGEAELAARYPDYFDDTAVSDEYEQTDLPATADDSPSHPISSLPHSTTTPSHATYQPYTMSDFRTLPKEVKLGRLGANVDPANVEARGKKRQQMKVLERQVREDNRRRMERVDRLRVVGGRGKEDGAGEDGGRGGGVGGGEEKQQEEEGKEVARRVASDSGGGGMDQSSLELSKGKIVSGECERKDDKKSEEKKQSDSRIRDGKRASMDRPKLADKSSGKSKAKKDAEKVDVVSQLLLEQEKERQKVMHIRQSLGLK